MAAQFLSINDEIKAFIEKQHMFFVASAPLLATGHVNVSPKGYDALRLLGPNEVMYLDFTGSGNETSAHIGENGRITLMFCSFDKNPLITKLYGIGEVILQTDERFEKLMRYYDPLPGIRQIIRMDIHLVVTSCGYGVPFYEYVGERDTMERWALQKGEEGLALFQEKYNMVSLDGAPTPLSRMVSPL